MLNNKENKIPFVTHLNDHLSYKSDRDNVVYSMVLQDFNLVVIHLSKGNMIEPHYHLNSSVIIFLVSGTVKITLINPLTNENMHKTLQKGDVLTVPEGWWHYKQAIEDETYMIKILNKNNVHTVYGSDIWQTLPVSILEEVYGLEIDSEIREEKIIKIAKLKSKKDQTLQNISDEFHLTTRLLPYEEIEADMENFARTIRIEDEYKQKNTSLNNTHYPHRYICPTCRLSYAPLNENVEH